MSDLTSLVPTSFDEALTISAHIAKSQLIPTNFKDRPEDVLVAILYGLELGFKPLTALSCIAVINGKTSVYGDGLIALVRSSPLCEFIDEQFDDETMVATCTAKRKNQRQLIVRTFSKIDATKAGLYKRNAIWSLYEKRMIAMRARAFCLRDGFADLLKGVAIYEEASDIQPADTIPFNDIAPADTPDACQTILDKVEASSTGQLADLSVITRDADTFSADIAPEDLEKILACIDRATKTAQLQEIIPQIETMNADDKSTIRKAYKTKQSLLKAENEPTQPHK